MTASTNTTRPSAITSIAIAEALRRGILAIVDAGFVLQVDDAVLANYYDLQSAGGRSRAGFREWAQLRIDALNHAFAGIPEDRVRYHICYGSWHGPHICDAPFAKSSRRSCSR